jgi:hypothetical protein
VISPRLGVLLNQSEARENGEQAVRRGQAQRSRLGKIAQPAATLSSFGHHVQELKCSIRGLRALWPTDVQLSARRNQAHGIPLYGNIFHIVVNMRDLLPIVNAAAVR